MIEQGFMNRNTFTKLVDEAILDKKMTYIDAVLHICEEKGIEPEDVKKFISSIVKSKIEAEAQSLNLLPQGGILAFE
jgi:hypothetical protein